jgi:hypothetical protein
MADVFIRTVVSILMVVVSKFFSCAKEQIEIAVINTDKKKFFISLVACRLFIEITNS